MKTVKTIFLMLVCGLIFSPTIFGQENISKNNRQTTSSKSKAKVGDQAADKQVESLDTPESAETPAEKISADDDRKNLRREVLSEEESAILPYYNNYLSEYRLGPQDVISIEVFGQCPDYCRSDITVPPTAEISYPLIREGISVGGKTIEQVQEEVRKELNEYIIDPHVTITLKKVGSARYSVLGDVAQPGVKLMERRLSVNEAIVEAGGILRTGDKKRVVIYRQTPNGITPLAINLDDAGRNKAEMVYLVPGDQVIVPGNKIKTVEKVLDIVGKLSIVRLLFGSPF